MAKKQEQGDIDYDSKGYVCYMIETRVNIDEPWRDDSILYSQEDYLDGKVASILRRKAKKNVGVDYRVMRHIVKEIENVPARTRRCPECGQLIDLDFDDDEE